MVDWKQIRQRNRKQPPGGTWRLSTAALALLTLTLVVLALLNVRQLWVYRQPTDGVLWQRTTAGLEVAAVARGADTPLRRGDLLAAINGQLLATPDGVARRLYAAGIGGSLNDTVLRGSRLLRLAVPVRAARPPLARYAFLEGVGLLYLAIGLFVFYRRRSAPLALPFYLFCLASFALLSFHVTGKLNVFDQTVFWINEAGLLAAPCVLLEFAWRFPGTASPRAAAARLLRWLAYAPAVLLGLAEVALATGAIWLPVSVSALQGLLDRAAYLLLAAYFLAAIVLFYRRTHHANARVATQARVMARGTLLALGPFLVLYIAPYLAGFDLPRWANVSVISLVLVPLAFAYAIWRHHLLEAEIVFRRGVVYTLATVLVVGAYWGVIGLAGILIHSRLPTWGWAGWLLAIVVTALLFEPVKRWLQERLDRSFYRERYDYRRTLMDFGRQINAQPDLDTLLQLVPERLAQTLEIEQVALFLAPAPGEPAAGFVLARARRASIGSLDLAFLDWFHRADAERLFFENPRGAARSLGLHYFLPCQRQGRTAAVIGLGKTTAGDFLSSEDLELVETLAGYLAIAIENARLYDTLRGKAEEFQRLKDFNENIVESIQVGVVATDLQGRVESWNAQMELLVALPRAQALGRPLAGLLGEDFAHEFAHAAAHGGIHAQRKFRMTATGSSEPAAARIVNLAVAPLVTARFERVGHIVLLSDVTAEVEMEQRLIQADRLRSVGLLAAGVAHEVNTPLAVISSYTQLLARQTPASDPRAPVLDTITRQTFRASEIVANLLNFSRTGAAQFQPVELNAVVRDTMALIEHPLRSAGVHVVTSLDPAGVQVLGDGGKLQQVFLNLILNARDAMPRGGTLRLSTGSGAGDSAWVEISDTGMGIPPELHHRIFDPFFTTKPARGSRQLGDSVSARAGSSRKWSGHPSASASMSTGTGLGLAVTYGIVEEHCGSIQVHSEPGRGAAFRIELPRLLPERVAAPALAV
ncbi:MAG: ATP-binding protein [Terriglobales bacterium]